MNEVGRAGGADGESRTEENIDGGKLSGCHKAVLEAVGGIWRTIFTDGGREDGKTKSPLRGCLVRCGRCG